MSANQYALKEAATSQSQFGELLQRLSNLNEENEKYFYQIQEMQERLQQSPPMPVEPLSSQPVSDEYSGLINSFSKYLDRYESILVRHNGVFGKLQRLI